MTPPGAQTSTGLPGRCVGPSKRAGSKCRRTQGRTISRSISARPPTIGRRRCTGPRWLDHRLDVKALLAQASACDARIGTSMRLMLVLGLRHRESVQCRHSAHIHPFSETGLSADQKQADRSLWLKGKGGRVRWLALATDGQWAAIEQARRGAGLPDAHRVAPERDLETYLRRLNPVQRNFGVSQRDCASTGHGARHQRAAARRWISRWTALHGWYCRASSAPRG